MCTNSNQTSGIVSDDWETRKTIDEFKIMPFHIGQQQLVNKHKKLIVGTYTNLFNRNRMQVSVKRRYIFYRLDFNILKFMKTGYSLVHYLPFYINMIF